jgi:hypothetical protein
VQVAADATDGGDPVSNGEEVQSATDATDGSKADTQAQSYKTVTAFAGIEPTFEPMLTAIGQFTPSSTSTGCQIYTFRQDG